MCIQCRDQCNTQSVIVFSFQLDNVTFNYFIETGLLTTADSTYMAPMQLICHDRTTTKQRSIRVCLCSSSLSSVLTTTMQFQAVVFWCCIQQQICIKWIYFSVKKTCIDRYLYPCFNSSKLHRVLIVTHQGTKWMNQAYLEKACGITIWMTWLDSITWCSIWMMPYLSAIEYDDQGAIFNHTWATTQSRWAATGDDQQSYINSKQISFSQRILDPGLIMVDGYNQVQWYCYAYISRCQHKEWFPLLHQVALFLMLSQLLQYSDSTDALDKQLVDKDDEKYSR